MHWHDFVKATDNTAIYPGAGTGSIAELCYVALGLAGEMGEAVEVADRPDLAKLELLDALWYVARGQQALKTHGYKIEGIDEDLPDLHGDQAAAPLLVANTTKKLLRDGFDKEKLDTLSVLYRDSLNGIFQMLAQVEPRHENWQQQMARFGRQLRALTDKLNSRKNRGVLHGSGDNR